MKYLIYLLFGLIAFASCTTADESDFEFDLSTVYNQINFEKPSVGQVSTYIHFEGYDFGSSNSAIDYTEDTLLVSLIAKSGNNFTFQERITNGSAVYGISTPYIEGHDMLKTSEWQVLNDTLRLTGGSTFLYWKEIEGLPFELSEDANTSSLRTWGPTNSTQNPPFKIASGNINGFAYKDIIAAYASLTIIIDGDGFETIYNSPFGIVRTSQISSQTFNGVGWDLKLGK